MSLETPESQLQLLQMKDAQETVTFVRESLDEMETGRERKLLKRMSARVGRLRIIRKWNTTASGAIA